MATNLNLGNSKLENFLRKLQETWRGNINSQFDDSALKPIDLSPTEASISRLIADQDHNNNDSFLREWAAFLGPMGHLRSAGGSQAGERVADIVRKEAAGLRLPSVKDSIIVFDPAPVVEGKQRLEQMEGIDGMKPLPQVRDHNAIASTSGNAPITTVDVVSADNERTVPIETPEDIEQNPDQNKIDDEGGIGKKDDDWELETAAAPMDEPPAPSTG